MIELPRVQEARGDLAFLEADTHVPFDIRRVFYIKDVPAGGARAGHALKSCDQLIVAVQGSFDVIVDDGTRAARCHVDDAVALYVPRMVWRDLESFSPGAVCLVLASEHYSDRDYIRDRAAFLPLVGGRP